jgi:hypothetical protein
MDLLIGTAESPGCDSSQLIPGQGFVIDGLALVVEETAETRTRKMGRRSEYVTWNLGRGGCTMVRLSWSVDQIGMVINPRDSETVRPSGQLPATLDWNVLHPR